MLKPVMTLLMAVTVFLGLDGLHRGSSRRRSTFERENRRPPSEDMGLILPPDTGTRPSIIPVPIRTVIMLPRGGITPVRFYTAHMIMPRGRFRPAGTTRLRRLGLIPIIVDINRYRMGVQQKINGLSRFPGAVGSAAPGNFRWL